MPYKVLIVDDESHVLRVAELGFCRAGFEVVTARNGQQALERIAADLPHLMVMDVQMPIMDGLETLRRVKSNPLTAGIVVIMLTARGPSINRLAAEAEGAVLFVTKPFSPTQLALEAQRFLSKPTGGLKPNETSPL